jgi:hypothetical protein
MLSIGDICYTAYVPICSDLITYLICADCMFDFVEFMYVKETTARYNAKKIIISLVCV